MNSGDAAGSVKDMDYDQARTAEEAFMSSQQVLEELSTVEIY